MSKNGFAVLEKFTEQATDHIFRGRLQLYKDSTGIRIEAKGELIGTIPVSLFKKSLTEIKTS